uniref:Gamma-interferon-inducible lysosomal thiol reductase n=1 Tax=Timema shepardi TaxID=629360 RepID=A0A7R9APY1_TIMSH|nr:unnamed protein product [Timema shepardi]
MMTPSLNFLRYKILLLIVVVFILWQSSRMLPSFSSSPLEAVPREPQLITASPISPVQVTVFYEALCPDSRSFFIKQLIPTFERASRLVDIVLVPYGKAKTEVVEGGGYSFMCQHGPIECEANKIHACAVVKVRHEATRLKFIACMIADNLRPTDIGQSCAEQWNIAWEPILECATGSEGSDLLKRHGDATDALNPKATFIPTILLDQSQEHQPAILKDLFKEICHELKLAHYFACDKYSAGPGL